MLSVICLCVSVCDVEVWAASLGKLAASHPLSAAVCQCPTADASVCYRLFFLVFFFFNVKASESFYFQF